MPAQHDDNSGSHDIDRPSDRRRQARESTYDIGYTRDDEASASRGTENFRDVEVVISIDCLSNSEAQKDEPY